jgi:hypothetical protein
MGLIPSHGNAAIAVKTGRGNTCRQISQIAVFTLNRRNRSRRLSPWVPRGLNVSGLLDP